MTEETPVRACYDCGGEYSENQMEAIDISPDDQCYHEFIYVCAGCIKEAVRQAEAEWTARNDAQKY